MECLVKEVLSAAEKNIIAGARELAVNLESAEQTV